MKNWVISLHFIAVFLFHGLKSHAQNIDSVMSVYEEQYPHEKLYLHFDKVAYNKKETIWFKVYMMTATSAVKLSKTIYTDWFDGTGKLIAHNVLPVLGASAQGQFEIPGEYKFANLHLRAYTKWMLNFDSSFYFEKDILINQAGVSGIIQTVPITEVKLFPEGGDLVNELSSKISFLASNQAGEPVSIKGAVMNGKGELIDSFASRHDGMGSFDIANVNANESYTVSWLDEFGKSGKTEMPLVKKNGATVQVVLVGNKARVRVQKSPGSEANLKTLYLLAHMNQQLLYKAKINLDNKNSALTELNTIGYPTGILQLTLFNASWQALAERIVFVNNHQYQFEASINSITKGVGQRSRNIIEVEVIDSVMANMSVSVTDGELLQEENTIVSQFLLSGEIKGRIRNPAFYFRDDADSTRQFLDLVMRTHGWRRFKWDEVAGAKFPVIHYPKDSDYLIITGAVSGKYFSALEQKDFMTLILSNRKAGKQFIPVELTENGSFSKGGFVFYDTAQAYYRFKDKKLTEKIELDLKTNISPVGKPYFNGINKYRVGSLDTAFFTRERFLLAEKKRLEKLMSETTLKEVSVFSKFTPKTRLDTLNEKYTSGAFMGEAKYSADILSDPSSFRYPNLFAYLQTYVTGLTITNLRSTPPLSPDVSLKPQSAFYEVLWRGETPYMYLNESLSEIDVLAGIPMSDIAYIKVFSSPFFGAWANGLGGAISVYTRRGNENFSNTDDREYKKILMGYTKYKEFSLPNYSDSIKTFIPDTRTTLYWNPFLITDAKNQKVQFEFYNNDVSKKLRVVLEGMNANGKMIRIEKVLE
jgi:hypothetical protein